VTVIRNPLEPWIAAKIGVPPEALSREVLEAYQFRRLRQTIAYVKERSSYYREKLRGVDPEEIAGYEQFARLPFTAPEELQIQPQRLVCTSQQEIARIVTLQSSGTTGPGKRLYFTREDQELTIDFFDHGMRNLVGPGDRVMILLPGQTPGSVGDLLKIGLARLGAVPVPYGLVEDPGEALAAALKEDVNALVGIPVQVLSLARHREGRALRGRLKSILLSTDYVPRALCRVLEDTWGCRVFHHYGMTEMGLGGGVQCPARQGYHLREADLFFEIVDPVTGEPVPDGVTGEVVFTTLTRTGMPLIRYRTGDLSRFIPEGCACGTVLESLDLVQGRLAGRVRLGNQALSLPEMDEVLFGLEGLVDYQVTLVRGPGKSVLQVEVQAGEGRAVDRDAVVAALAAIPAVRDLWPDQLEIRVSQGQLPRRGAAKRTITVQERSG